MLVASMPAWRDRWWRAEEAGDGYAVDEAEYNELHELSEAHLAKDWVARNGLFEMQDKIGGELNYPEVMLLPLWQEGDRYREIFDISVEEWDKFASTVVKKNSLAVRASVTDGKLKSMHEPISIYGIEATNIDHACERDQSLVRRRRITTARSLPPSPRRCCALRMT